MKHKYLEIIFALFLLLTIVVSVTDLVKPITIDYGKHLQILQNNTGTVEIRDYLEQINNTTDTIVIVARDLQGDSVSEDFINALSEIGINDIHKIYEKEYPSFACIISEGNILYQNITSDEMISYGTYIDGHYVLARSASINTGSVGEVYVDNVQYAANASGINIVQMNLKDNVVIDSVVYDIQKGGDQ